MLTQSSYHSFKQWQLARKNHFASAHHPQENMRITARVFFFFFLKSEWDYFCHLLHSLKHLWKFVGEQQLKKFYSKTLLTPDVSQQTFASFFLNSQGKTSNNILHKHGLKKNFSLHNFPSIIHTLFLRLIPDVRRRKIEENSSRTWQQKPQQL